MLRISDDTVIGILDPDAESVEIRGVRVIGKGAFAFSRIRRVTMADVEEIHARAFMDCELLEEVHIPSSVRYISSYAFSGSGLHTIHLPPNIALGKDVFFLSRLSLVVSDTPIMPDLLPRGCRVITTTKYEALKKLGAHRMGVPKSDLSIRTRRPDPMPRTLRRIEQRKAKVRKAEPRTPPKIRPRTRPRTPPRRPGRRPRSDDCTICLKPSCEHLNMSRRLGAPVMW